MTLKTTLDNLDTVRALIAERDYICRVLTLVDPYECDEVLWSVDDSQLRFQVNCSDLFWWATADCEEITPDNVGELEQAYSDCKAATGGEGLWQAHAQSLFAARVRKMRPQGACYKSIPQSLWPLFDAVGPERTKEDGDTRRPAEPREDCEWSRQQRHTAYINELNKRTELLRAELEAARRELGERQPKPETESEGK